VLKLKQIITIAELGPQALIMGLLFLTSCSSYDLGDKPPDKVAVNPQESEWETGIGALIELKCASCHQSDKGSFVPANTPNTLDNIGNREFFMDPENVGKIALARSRITARDKPMPPEFATPLTSDERLALTNFFDQRLSELQLNGESFCERLNRQSPSQVSYQDVQPIVTANCARAGCHNADSIKPPPLTTKPQLVDLAENALVQLEAGTMPVGNPDFLQSDAGVTLAAWLCNSR
jgi:uncharacterized membrane protein